MTRWTKQTYEMVAEVLRNARGVADPDSDAAIMTLDSLTSSFAEIFRMDSHRFDEGRFRRAAGGHSRLDDDDERFIDIGTRGGMPSRFRRRPAEVRVRQHARRNK